MYVENMLSVILKMTFSKSTLHTYGDEIILVILWIFF